MRKTEQAELTVLCLLQKDDRILLQDRKKNDWKGYVLPGWHIEPGESVVDAVIREMQEETGLTVIAPKLCGVKQFPLRDGNYENGRFLVFLFRSDRFTGELRSSEEGEMHWVRWDELDKVPLVEDARELFEVMLSDDWNEFQYTVENGNWKVNLK